MTAPRTQLAQLQFSYVGTYAAMVFLVPSLVDEGLSTSTAAGMMALIPLGTLFAGPAWSMAADAAFGTGRVLRWTAALTTLGVLGLMLPLPYTVLGLVVFAACRAPLAPLLDALTLRELGDKRDAYGSIRVWGSVAFVLLVGLAGWLRTVAPGPYWLVPPAAFMAFTTWRVRGLPTPPPVQTGVPLHLVLAAPRLRWLLLACVLHGMATSHHDMMFSLRIDQQGLPPWVTSLGTATGVTVEIAVLAFAQPLLARFGTRGLLLLGMASGVPRWWAVSVMTGATGLIAVQAMHGLTFAAFWVAAVKRVASAAPAGREGSVQSLLPAATFGVGTLAATLSAGWALQFVSSASVYGAMSAVSAAATAVGWWATRRR